MEIFNRCIICEVPNSDEGRLQLVNISVLIRHFTTIGVGSVKC